MSKQVTINRIEFYRAFQGCLEGSYQRCQAEVVREHCEWEGIPGRVALPPPRGEKPMWLGYAEISRGDAGIRLRFWTEFRPDRSVEQLLAPALQQVDWEMAVHQPTF